MTCFLCHQQQQECKASLRNPAPHRQANTCIKVVLNGHCETIISHMLYQYFCISCQLPMWIFITGTTVLQHVGLLVQTDIAGTVTIYTLLVYYPTSNMIFRLSPTVSGCFYGTDWGWLCSVPGAGESVRWGKDFGCVRSTGYLTFISIQKCVKNFCHFLYFNSFLISTECWRFIFASYSGAGFFFFFCYLSLELIFF